MQRNPITFDRFIRGILILVGIALAIYLVNLLSGVLLPFAVAMLLSYLTFPLVKFLQYNCRLKNRPPQATARHDQYVGCADGRLLGVHDYPLLGVHPYRLRKDNNRMDSADS